MFASVPGSVKEAVKAIQVQINLMKPGSFLVIDGIIGPLTRGAYRRLSSDQRKLIDDLAASRNSSLKAELKAAEIAPMAQGSNMVTAAQAKIFMRDAIAKYGDLPGALGIPYLTKALSLEASKGRTPGTFDASSRSVDPRTRRPGSYYGLYQIGRAAYDEVARTGRIADLPLFQVAVYSPWFNTALALVYAQVLVKQLQSDQVDGKTKAVYRAYKGPITLDILYSAHNQGSLGLKMGARNAKAGGQSKAAGPVVAAALEQMRSWT